jgi:hypothetical protein
MKRALLVGINYIGTEYRLNGCINDINNMTTFLSSIGYTEFIKYTDETTDSKLHPTRNNILIGFQKLLKNVKAGDELWFHYSGHGTLQKDINSDEISGMDSCICPLDFTWNGLITDDIIRANLAVKVPVGVKLIIVLDACHSGTGSDLRFKCDDSSYLKKNLKISTVFNKNNWLIKQTITELQKYSSTNGNVFLISGCMDTQTSADAFIQNKWTGALTYGLLYLLKSNPNYTWNTFLKDLNCFLKVSGYTQKPVLSCGNTKNLTTKIF